MAATAVPARLGSMSDMTGKRGPAMGTDVAATLREMWTTRPYRRRSEAKLAGVAAAIARRYAVDPVLVRVGFVVAAFYGIGFALYLAGWLVLPRDPHDPPRRIPHPVLLVLLVLCAIATSGAAFRGHPAPLAGLAIVALLLFLLHRYRGTPPSGPVTSHPGTSPTGTSGSGAAAAQPPTAASATPTAPGAGAATPPGTTSGSGPATASNEPATSGSGPATTSGPGPDAPPAWDPLGTAPFAWDLPELGPDPTGRVTAPQRSRLTVATLGLALLAGGVSGGLLLAGGNLGGLCTVLGAMLGVIGVGLVVGAFRHGGRGLVLPAIPLILLTYGVTAAPLGHFHGIGQRTWDPTSVAAVAPAYRLSAGDATLDLRQLPLTAADHVRTAVDLGAGNATVLVPSRADVTAHCHAGLGRLDCLGRTADGQHPDRTVVDAGPGGPGGGLVDLEVSVGAGHVEVRRG